RRRLLLGGRRRRRRRCRLQERHRHRRWRQHVDVPERVDKSRDDQAAVKSERDGARQRAGDARLGLVLGEVCLERHRRAYLFLLRLVATLPLVVFALALPSFLASSALAVAAAAPFSGLSPAASLPGAGAPSLGIGLPIASNVLFRHSVDLSTHFCHSFGDSKNAYDFWRYSRFT